MLVTTKIVNDIPKYKVSVGRQDTWNVNHTLACIIVPVLKKYKALAKGVPCVFTEDLDVKDFDKGEAAWNAALDCMINAFSLIAAEKHEDDYEERAEVKKGLALFAEHFNNLWD